MSAESRTSTIAVSLAGISFAIHLALAVHLGATGSLDQYDVFFHADTKARLDCVVAGSCDNRASISHPALDLLVNPPVRGVAKVAAAFGGFEGDESVARHAFALWVSPFASGLATALAFVLFTSLGMSLGAALLATALVTLSLSALVFGSIPESFALSGATIAGAFVLAARSKPEQGDNRLAWLALATVATAVTVTNLATILIVFVASRWIAKEPAPLIARKSLVLLLASAALTSALALTSHALYDSRALSAEEGTRYITKWTEGNDPIDRALWFVTAASNSVSANMPELASNFQANKNDSRYKFRFTFDDTPSVLSTSRPLGSLLVALAIVGGAVMFRGSRPQRAALWAALAILLVNGALHSFWGVGHFLYSQHWHLAFSLLVVGPLFAAARFQLASRVVLLATLLAVVVQNWSVGRLMLAHFSLTAP